MWIVIDKGKGSMSSSYELTSYNESFNKDSGEYELWVERKTGKNILIMSSKERTDILEVKQALDFAIANGEPIFDLTTE